MRLGSRLVVIIAALGVAPACTHAQRTDIETVAAKALVSPEEEAEIGLRIQAQLHDAGTRFVKDPVVVGYAESIGARLADAARAERPDLDIHVHVIDDPRTVNAFATPGGHLYVYTGLILAARTEAELAGVLAHEIGHIVGRHAARQMVDQFGIETLTRIALGKDASDVAKIATQLAGAGAMLAHSRGQETEADEYAARFTAAASYDPRALVSFFRELQKREGGRESRLEAWLSTHPLTSDRIAALEAYIAENRLRGGEEDSGRLALVKARLR